MSRLLTTLLALCILFVCMAFAAEPAMAATTPSCIASIGVSQDGSSGSTGVNDCKEELSGHIIIDRDLNDGAGGGALYLHYQRFSGTALATYHYLTSAGARTSSTQSATVKTHTETMTKTPSYATSVTYDGRIFTFKGWREDNTATTTSTTSPSVTYMTSPKTYCAVYSGTLTLGYNANGGSGAPSAQTATQYVNAGSSSISKQSKTFTLSLTKPTYADKCAFLGWSTSSSASSVDYAPGNSITISSNTTLYAVWKDHSYTNNVCTGCSKIIPGITPVATLSKNGRLVGAYATLDAATTAAEKCTTADKAVVQFQQDINLGDVYQNIEGGVFTIDLNGFEISYENNSIYSALDINNAGTHITLISSRAGGTVSSKWTAISTGSSTQLTATGIRVSAGSDGIFLNGSAALSDVTINAGKVGVFAQNENTLTVTNCTINAERKALFVGSKVTAAVTGGSLTGGTDDIEVTGSITVSGTTFPGGVSVISQNLRDILAEGQAYWAGDTMIVPAAGQKAITGRGDITIKAACKHESGTKQDYANNGSNDNYAYSCCGAIYTEAHAYSAENGLCPCGAIKPNAAALVSKNGAVVGEYASLDAAVTAAEKCTAADKAVVQLQKDIDLGTVRQYIDSGVISNATIEAGSTGIYASDGSVEIVECTIDSGLEGVFAWNGSILKATDCPIEAGVCAVFVCPSASATITGGSMTSGSGYADIDAVGNVMVSGTTFPGGVTVFSKTLSAILAEGQAYWAGDRMIVLSDGQTEISGMGDITVKAACTHEGGTKQDYVNNGDDHGFTYSCCSASYTEAHAYRAENGLCPCGHINPEATVMVEGAQNAWFVTFTDALAAWTDGTTMKLLGDVTYSETVTIPAGESRTLDLNGQTWTSGLQTSSLLINQGSLTITDTGSGKTGAIMQNKSGADLISSTGSLTIQGGRLEGGNRTVNLEGGTTVFSGGEIIGTGDCAARLDDASLTVSGTTHVEGNGCGIDVVGSASLKVTGGTICSESIAVIVSTNASAVISGGTISSAYGVYCYGSVTLAAPASITGRISDFYFFNTYPDARIIVDFDMSGVGTPYVIGMQTPREFAVKTERGTLSLQAFTEAEYNKNRNAKIIATESGLAMIPCQHEEGFDENGVCYGCGGLIKLPLLVEDVRVTSANCSDALGDDTMRFDFATQTLYLNNAHIKGDISQGFGCIVCNDSDEDMPLKIHLTGENTVSCKGYNGIYSEYDCIITGDGSLTVTGTGAGLLSFSDMTISAQVSASSVDAFDGLCVACMLRGT